MYKRFRATHALLASAALLAACGGGSEPIPDDVEGLESVQEPTLAEPVLTGGISAAESALMEREAAQGTCSATSFRKPRVAAWDMSRDDSAARQALLARFSISVVNMPADNARTAAFVKGVKSTNGGAAIAQYVNFPDLKTSPASTEYGYALAAEATLRDWWLKDATGNSVSWTGGATRALNMTGWAPTSASGQRYPQYKSAYDNKLYFAGTSMDYAFVGNTWARPRLDADWRRSGTSQSRFDPTIESATRAGYAAYWSGLRSLTPSIKVIGGLDNGNDLSSAEFKNQLDGAFLDGMIGKAWSLEAKSGWAAMLSQYRTVMANTRGDKSVIFSVYGASPIDYATMRYGLASAAMDDGLFMFIPASGSQVPAWYDEYSAQLGNPVDAPPKGPAQNGIWMRRFENGLALVNPSKTASATIDVGAGYQRLAGTQDSAVNNGAVQSTVTLGPRQGLLMLKVPAPCASATYATPRVAALDYSKDTSTARQDLLAKYKFVILSFSKSQGAAKLQQMASAIKARNPDVPIAQYVAINEAKCVADPTQDTYAVSAEVIKNNWWLRKADGSIVQWTALYGNCDVNIGAYTPKDAQGQTYAQFKWQDDYDAWFKDAPAIDYVFVDNFWDATRSDADWKRSGVDLLKASPEANSIFRQGMASYASTVRSVVSRLKVIGNINHDLSAPEYANVLDGGFMEGLIGKSWSRETWAGWSAMMAMYHGALQRTRVPGNAFLNTFADPTDYKTIRYGLASAMMDNGYFVHLPLSGTFQPSWVDEYSAQIGDAAEAPPTAAAQNGIWMRRYTNGLVLVNPSKTTAASIYVGSGYKRLSGTQDPAVNNGKTESTVTLGPREGLLMLRQ